LLSGCAWPPTPVPTATRSPTETNTPTPTDTQTPTLLPSLTPTPRGTPGVWGNFPGPRETAVVTPIPPPFPALVLPEELRVVVLVGLDQAEPFNGRSDAILLVLYHPRLAKAALISLPPDLIGYLPGYGMQRLSSAYALGGGRLLTQTIEYNLGLRPDSWLAANMDDFSALVDALGGLKVSVLQNLPGVCGDVLYIGDILMYGDLALCYARLRYGMDEAARGLRQQQLFQLVLLRMVQGGNLVRLPELYQQFRGRVDTSLTAADFLENTVLLLRLGDPTRVKYYQIGSAQARVWQISGELPADVFLPERAAFSQLLQKAVDFCSQPQSPGEVVVTLAYELTTSPTPTPTLEFTPTFPPTPTETFPPTLTLTPSPTGPTPTRSLTPTITVTPSPAP
jgi:polyisoprenyl-teichoic acid--peptidoglycan teichoic acid transferase